MLGKRARGCDGVRRALPGGSRLFVGIPLAPFPYDVAAAQVKEARIEHVFSYAHVFPRCVAMLGSGAIEV
ncbi:hypothetical protein BH10PSE9_BH10PSE9_17410 [soil metagenome]